MQLTISNFNAPCDCDTSLRFSITLRDSNMRAPRADVSVQCTKCGATLTVDYQKIDLHVAPLLDIIAMFKECGWSR